MGLLTALKLYRENFSQAAQYPIAPRGRTGVISPWSEGQLQQVVWSDIFGTATTQVTRHEAMTLPSVVAGRAIILGELAHRPLRALRNGELVEKQPPWLSRTDTGVPPWFRIAHTIDDLIFYGQSLWAVDRNTDGSIKDAGHIPYDQWDIDEDGFILVDDYPVPPEQVIYFQGPSEGLLTSANRTIRAAIDVEHTWADRAKVPLPQLLLQEREAGSLTQEEAQDYVNAIAEARRSPNGSVMFIPAEMEARIEGDIQTDLMIEARNAVKLDIASFLNLPASRFDAALPKSSLNYETQESNQALFQERLPYWTAPIEARLSMDDVVPRGQIIAFDFSDTSTAPSAHNHGPYRED